MTYLLQIIYAHDIRDETFHSNSYCKKIIIWAESELVTSRSQVIYLIRCQWRFKCQVRDTLNNYPYIVFSFERLVT